MRRLISFTTARKATAAWPSRSALRSAAIGIGLLLVLAMTRAARAQAPVPFVELNAATSAGVATNGTVIGPNYYFGTLASEATGRKAVVLSGRGEFVSFTLTAPANAVTVHYAIPD